MSKGDFWYCLFSIFVVFYTGNLYICVFVTLLISNFCRVLNVVCFLLGNSPASEFYMPTFRNTLSVPSSQAGRNEGWLDLKMLEYLYGKRFGSSQTLSRIHTPTFSNLVVLQSSLPVKMEQTECSETSAYKIQMLGNYPEENIQYLWLVAHPTLFMTHKSMDCIYICICTYLCTTCHSSIVSLYFIVCI